MPGPSMTAPAPPACTQEDRDDVGSPELTDEEFAREILPPEVYAALPSRGGRPRGERPEQLVSLRLDPDVVETFKATGPGWQTRMNEVPAEAAQKLRAASRTIAATGGERGAGNVRMAYRQAPAPASSPFIPAGFSYIPQSCCSATTSRSGKRTSRSTASTSRNSRKPSMSIATPSCRASPAPPAARGTSWSARGTA